MKFDALISFREFRPSTFLSAFRSLSSDIVYLNSKNLRNERNEKSRNETHETVQGAVNTVQLIVIEMAHTQQEEEEIAAR